MQILTDPRAMQRHAQSCACQSQSIGFVPTLGALHAGHLELCRRAKAENSQFFASIFVNPLQFGPNEDLDKYPRPLQSDLELLEKSGCDAVFTPETRAMVGATDALHGTHVEVSPFDEMWEGVTRPGHLRGVATIVTKLFNLVLPTRAYFGEKDFQQLRVVQALVRDLNFPIEIVPIPTVRESDGLALSSRNRFLSSDERAAASAIPRALQAGKSAAQSGETGAVELGRVMTQILDAEPLLKVQYLAIIDAKTLQPLQKIAGEARVILAAHVGETRLIDNIAL